MVLKAADEQQSPPSGVLIKKIEQLRAVRSFSWNAVFFKYILGCLCKTVSIRYNKTERRITMEFTGSYRHKLKYPISPADALALRQRLRAVMKRNPHTVYTIRSVYFDNYKDKALREKANGVQKREKFRIRYHSQKKGRRTT